MPALTPEQEALKPCPLCGAQPKLEDIAGWEISCDCGVNLCLLKPDMGPLIAHWNRRAQLEGCNEDYGCAVDSVGQLQDEVDQWRAKYEAALQQPVQAVPDILFDGMAVYEEITRMVGKGHCISPEAVAATLDAAVRMIRAAGTVRRRDDGPDERKG